MAFFKARVGGTLYEIDKLTLGDTRILKHKFGLTDLVEFSSTDPDVIVGLLALAIHKANPATTIDDAAAEAEGLDFESFAPVDAAEDEDADAAPLGVGAVTADPSKSGKSGKPRKTPGARS